ncbi:MULTISPECIES: hypothetical protein [Alkalihalophilus]|uniref:Uncharacterized protein n=1 Tax=Alkalihalophilus pseudofirmus (strain ATCC BAA-2126 / JCM 17055 / OF4) TaxID=398511 RepID=D3G1J8_ALKPO|nr:MULTISPECIES: hypothetical protein [Alkalihalophilus]ADC52224.1 hypothetical protein BpOF4_21144 [Alkalihalophilus pseudofirmus OF4]MEC2074366.1 hypothetical protein [Alkalihalophilus marmarensis]
MKITDLILLFFIFLIPITFGLGIKSFFVKEAIYLSNTYDTAMTTATIDATRSLLMNERQEYESGYQSAKYASVNLEQAGETFFHTLYNNFGVVDDPIGQGTLKAFLPALAVLGYDALHLYVVDEHKDVNGMTIKEHKWLPPIPFTYKDTQGNLIYFTLDDQVTIYDVETKEWDEGKRDELATYYNIPLLHDKTLFEEVRKNTIVHAFQDEVAFYINEHNTYARQMGITYQFTLPTISQEDWLNSIDDIGVLSFLQGIPLGLDQEYNNYAFGGGRLVRNHNFEGVIENGVRTAYRSDCQHGRQVYQTFSNAKQAAESGYFISRSRCNVGGN